MTHPACTFGPPLSLGQLVDLCGSFNIVSTQTAEGREGNRVERGPDQSS